MFARILVPLDGSRLAESALPEAEALRKAFGSAVTLIHVLEADPPREAHGERHLSGVEEAKAYLDEAAGRFFPPDAVIERHVHAEGISDVPRSLSEHSRELGQDLIIMSVHGHGGLMRMVAGNLAERIMGRQTVPVLLMRAGAGGESAPAFHRVLAALDGKPGHEQGLPVAAAIARNTGARLLLVTIVPTWSTLMGERRATGRFLPGATSELLEITESSAAKYLAEKAGGLAASGVLVDTAVRRGNPARQIARAARELEADLIVLGTHGRSGTKAFWAGSTAHRIVGGTRTPLLLIPAVKGDTWAES